LGRRALERARAHRKQRHPVGSPSELQLVEYVRGVGENVDYCAHLYRKGLSLLARDRHEAALALYRRAANSQEPHQTHHPRWIDERGEVEYATAVERFRSRLERALRERGLL
jgi:hypothetical protein